MLLLASRRAASAAASLAWAWCKASRCGTGSSSAMRSLGRTTCPTSTWRLTAPVDAEREALLLLGADMARERDQFSVRPGNGGDGTDRPDFGGTCRRHPREPG